eukprot:312098_1
MLNTCLNFENQNPTLCVPTVIDKQHGLYGICSVFVTDININQHEQFNRWSLDTGDIKVLVIPYTDQQISTTEIEDESFIYHEKNHILSTLYNNTSNATNQFSVLLQHLNQLASHQRINKLIETWKYKNSDIQMLAFFIQLTYQTNEYTISTRSPTNKQSDKNVTLALFMTRPDEQIYLKCTISVNRLIWIEGIDKTPPYYQLYWALILFTKYFLNICSSYNWCIKPFQLKSQHITYHYHYFESGVRRTTHFIPRGIEPTQKGQLSYDSMIPIGIESFPVFNVPEINYIIENIKTSNISHFM